MRSRDFLGRWTVRLVCASVGLLLATGSVRADNCVCAPCDFDLDGDVDLDDFGHLQLCLTGSIIPQLDPACADAKLDADTDVDGADMLIFIGCLSGTNIPYGGTTLPPVIISEFMAANESTLADEDGDNSDWIELHNPCMPRVDISGWHLTDDPAMPNKWTFPQGVELPRGTFLIVFASGKDRRDPAGTLHANFSLEKNGEYLALTAPDGAIIHEYAPTYPPQIPDVAYGLAQLTAAPVTVQLPVRFHVPTAEDAAAGLQWTTADFDDSAWLLGPAGIGFSSSESLFNVAVYHAAASVSNLAAAESVLANPVQQLSVSTGQAPWVNFGNPTESGHYPGDWAFPGTNSGVNQDDFVALVTGAINIPTAGEWTFGVNSDEGFGLTLTRGGQVFSTNFPSLRTAEDTLAVFNITQPGVYQVRLVSFDRSGDAGLELFAAAGYQTAFDAAKFRLVGDVGGGGLAVGGLAGDIATDVGPIMQGANASLWARIGFDILSPVQFNAVTLKMKYEDGYVAYLNGQEVARRNAPVAVEWNSTATTNRPLSNAESFEALDVAGALNVLKSGHNVLAIQGLNDTAEDGDFLILPELVLASSGLTPRYFKPATPGALNGAGAAGFAEAVDVDPPRGFRNAPFALAMSTATPSSQIRYTLDGTLPTATTGTLYSGPIAVDRTSIVRAGAFRANYLPGPVATHTYIFVNDVIRQSPQGQTPGPTWPTGTVNGQVFQYGMDPDIVDNPAWRDLIVPAMTSIPSLSFVSAPSDLFDPATGLYTNSEATGMAWEKPVSVELINPDGSPGFQIDAGLRIRGGVYTVPGDNPKHAFKLYFRWIYGAGKLEFPIFGPGGATEFDRLDVKTANDDGWNWNNNSRALFIRDIFSRDCQRDMGQPTGLGFFYHLYLNGQYWGLYETEERTDKDYGATYFGGSPDDYDTIKPISGVFNIEAVDGNTDAYYALWQLAHDVGFSNYATYMRAQGLNTDGTRNLAYPVLLDVENSIIDNLVTYYTGDWDGPVSGSNNNNRANNFLALRRRTGNEGWRFFQHDSEISLKDAAIDRTGPWTVGQQFQKFNNQYLHQQLEANAEYKMRFADMAYKALYNGGALTPEASTARMNARVAEMGQAIIAESARWGDAKTTAPYTPANWQSELNWVLNSFLATRRETVIAQFKARGWYPNTPAPLLSQHGGPVAVGYPLTITRPAGASGTIYYTLDGSDPRAIGGGVAPQALTFSDSSVAFITRGSLWKYYDQGSLTGTSWRSTGFTGDANWPEGPAELGYSPDEHDEATVVGYGPDPNNKYVTTYFRHKFQVPPGTVCTSLTLGLLRDDGAVAYLNGNVAARDNLVSNYTSSTLATNCIEDLDTFYPTSLTPTWLNEGTNVVAVEVHQCTLDSTDLSFDLELTGTTTGTPIPISQNTVVKARLRNGTEWSPLAEALFVTEPVIIRINEFMAENSAVLEDPDEPGEYPDWFELYNPGTTDVDLGGKYLTDTTAQPTQFRIPNGVIIPHGGFLVFYADEDRTQGNRHTNFKLSKAGEQIALYDTDGVTLLDLVSFGAQTENVSTGRYPDGSGVWGFSSSPTPGGPNAPPP